MNQDIFKNLTEQTRKLFAPVQRYNQAMVENLEKVTEYQLNTIRNYADLGLKQIKSITDIDENADLADLGNRHMEWMSELSKRMLEDAQKLSEIGNDIKDSIEEIVREGMDSAAVAAEATDKQTAAKSKPRTK